MHENMRTLLNAYMDGELHGASLQEVELHLASCGSCQNELGELQRVSDLLQAAPTPEFMPAERFVSNLTLRLPRRTSRNLPLKSSSLAWWLIPAGLLAAWFFVQTVFTLTNVLTAAEATGMLGQAVNWLDGGQVTVWFAAVTSLFDGQVGGVQSTLSLMNELNVFGANFLDGLLWQALIVLLYWGWLSAWWFRRRLMPMEMDNAS